MKRIISFLVLLVFVISLCSCSSFDTPKSTTRKLPSYEQTPNNPEGSKKEKDTSEKTITETDPEPDKDSESVTEPETKPEQNSSKDVRDEPDVIRQEISNLLRDAEALIAEGLLDDAQMVLRDLRSRDLTESEKNKLNALYSSLNTISD